MGTVDQSDVKSTIMRLCSEGVINWHRKQLSFLIQAAVSWSHGNYNLDPSVAKPELFTEFHNMFLNELIDMSPNLRIYKKKSLFCGRKRKREQESSSQCPWILYYDFRERLINREIVCSNMGTWKFFRNT